MNIVLDDLEVRILGCLIEKEITTPEYYPLTLNALTNACNQKSNRDPIVSYDETTVLQGLEALQKKGLARLTFMGGSRTSKYLHTLLDRYDLSLQETAVLCELMLRGPQTVGEIRTRAGRMSPFDNLEETEKTLQALMDQDEPMTIRLPRETGRKECRYMHLFSGEPVIKDKGDVQAQISPENERISRLEDELSALKREFEELRQIFLDFRSQF